jgi:hypothetical protein
VVNSNFITTNTINTIELLNGNLDGCYLSVSGRSAEIRNVLVGRSPDADEEDDAGHITGGTQIYSSRKIDKVHADGDISSDVRIGTSSFYTHTKQISCGGTMAGTLYAGKMDTVLAGVDRQGNPLLEDDEFTGSDISGTMYAYFWIKKISATGKIINANISSAYSSITNIFAEDGFEETSVSVGRAITRIMVGFNDGNRRDVVNENADVSGSVSTRYLGRIYYTGNLAEDVVSDSMRMTGPLYDVIPGN